jgi:hypothetical protein
MERQRPALTLNIVQMQGVHDHLTFRAIRKHDKQQQVYNEYTHSNAKSLRR